VVGLEFVSVCFFGVYCTVLCCEGGGCGCLGKRMEERGYLYSSTSARLGVFGFEYGTVLRGGVRVG